DLAELTDFARGRTGDPKLALAHWDVAFWAERLREERYAYSEEALRPYFPLPVVLEGLFALARRLFGVVITAADGEAPVWHADVRRGRDPVPRVRARPPTHVDRGRLSRRRRHQQHRVGRCRAAEPVHGELVLSPAHPAGLRAPSSDGRSVAGRDLRAHCRCPH